MNILPTGAAGFIGSHLAEQLLGYRPSTPIEEGIPRLVEWFRGFGTP